MGNDGPFKIEKDGHLTWLIFNRPEKRNAMSLDFFYGLMEIFPKLDEDPDVRAIIIKAEGSCDRDRDTFFSIKQQLTGLSAMLAFLLCVPAVFIWM